MPPELLTVAELDRRLRRAVEETAFDVWVEGEITSLKISASGHAYFNLKDEREDACIDAVMYRSAALRARSVLRDGARVLVRGRATFWAPRGKLQFVIDVARPAGRGALLEALEQLRQKLAAEGLFAAERKKKLPTDPRIIGVVTSRTGAAIHDIARVAFRRGGAHILLAASSVQGERAADQIVLAFDRLERVKGVDVIIVGRGGGPADELAVFNDETVVRRIAACRIPVVSAVGHEVDVTLTDLVADVRAATPSQAAEIVVPETAARAHTLRQATIHLTRAMHARVVEDRVVLERLRGRLGDPRLLIGEKQQLVDDLRARIETAATRAASRRKDALRRLEARLAARHPRVVVSTVRARVESAFVRLRRAIDRKMAEKSASSGALAARLDALSPLAVLGRGYAVALSQDGRAIVVASSLRSGDAVRVRVHRGRFTATVDAVEDDE